MLIYSTINKNNERKICLFSKKQNVNTYSKRFDRVRSSILGWQMSLQSLT